MEEIDAFGLDRKKELEMNPKFAGSSALGYYLMYLDAHLGNNGTDLERGKVKFEYFTDRKKEEMDVELDKLCRRINERIAPLNGVCDGWKRVTRHFHYMYSDPECQPVKDMLDTAKRVSGRVLSPAGSVLSDLSVILKYGSPEALGLGIGGSFGDEGGAHQNNEFISCSELLEFAKIIGAYSLDYLK